MLYKKLVACYYIILTYLMVFLVKIVEFALLNSAGLFQTKYAETDRIPLFARRSLSRNATKSQSMSVLSFQEVPCCWHVT